MSPPLSLQNEKILVFYLVFTTSERISVQHHSGKFNWRHQRTVESIFHHHPTAKVNIYSNTLPQGLFNVFTEAGYFIRVQKYKLESLLKGTIAEGFIRKLDMARRGPFWYTNESNLLRIFLLYLFGGIYMDTDIIVVRPLHSLTNNSIGWQDRGSVNLNGAFLKFERGNAFLEACIKEFVPMYNGNVWGSSYGLYKGVSRGGL